MKDNVTPDFEKSAATPEIHDWNDHYWKERTPIALIVHSLAQKHNDIEQNQLSMRKEIVSDIVPAGVGIYEQSPILLGFTMLAGVIVYGLHAQAKTSEIEYNELLKIWAEYKNNCNDPDTQYSREEKREYAEDIVKERISEMNIKLTDIIITDTDHLNIAMTHAEKVAKKRNLIPHKKVTAQNVEQMGGRLKQAASKYGKDITQNIVAPFLDTLVLYNEAAKSCLADLKSPRKAFNGTMAGAKTTYRRLKSRKQTSKRKERRKHQKKKIQFIKSKTQSLPKSTIIKANIDPSVAKHYDDIIKNIDNYNPKQVVASLGFGFATGLAGVGIVGVGVSGAEAAYATSELQSTILQIGAGVWGLALGIGAWGQTGETLEHYHHVLTNERALEAQKHKELAKVHRTLIEASKRHEAKPKTVALPVNWRTGRADVSINIKPENDDNAPS